LTIPECFILLMLYDVFRPDCNLDFAKVQQLYDI
jgi:hypothetical protein